MIAILFLVYFVSPVMAQRKNIALIAADKIAATEKYLALIEDSGSGTFRFSDPELIEQALSSLSKQNFFNLTIDEAKNAGVRIGCDLMLIARSESLRRSSSKRNAYYQSYVVMFLVNTRTGDLINWTLLTADGDDAATADNNLRPRIKEFAVSIPNLVQKAPPAEIFASSLFRIDENTGGAVRAPLPFKRISPASTEVSNDLRVEAVVDIEVAIDEKGYVTQTKIMRWAGFGLDENVTETVRKMNFRPALIGGKAVPARFLLRYNFRVPKPEKNAD
jgi:hypothetical protein